MESMKNEDLIKRLNSEITYYQARQTFWRGRCKEMERTRYVFIALSVGIGAVAGFAFGALTGGV